MNHIKLVGLEVEGGWGGKPGVPPFDDVDLTVDRSIDGRMQPPDHRLETIHIGEAVSPPLSPDKKIINEWIDKHWPTSTNVTCGFHIHLSFHKIKDYSLLTTKTFLYTLHKRMEETGKAAKLPKEHYLWARLGGGNVFSKLNCDVSKQLSLKRKTTGDPTRYGFLNHCYRIHGTIEFRALPTFEHPKLAKIFTEEYMNVVEEFLDSYQDCMKFDRRIALYYGPCGAVEVLQ